MFLPTTTQEIDRLGWEQPDIILITGDAYLDSSFIGVAVIGKVLLNAGYKVGIIAQPDINSAAGITRLGEPALFWGVTAGAIDSMVANYTASKKRKKQDDFTAGGQNTQRPDRACIVYTNLIRKYFKNTKPIVLGGLEASLRRIAHYDYWNNTVRRSILFDAKADILTYGMAEKSITALAEHLKNNRDFRDIRGICYIAPEPKNGFITLPSYEEAKKDKLKFIEMFHLFYQNSDPITTRGLCQQQDTRYLIQNPPSEHLSTRELDAIYQMDYERAVHPYHQKQGAVRALETIKFSLTSHRGCYGECNFCSVAVHQGRTVLSRSESSIIKEAKQLMALKESKGYISDVGGPTANMYGIGCAKKLTPNSCPHKRCLTPAYCKHLEISHKRQIELLKKLRQLPGIKKVFIGSGIRYDMVLEDKRYGMEYLSELVQHHISGQLKIAPEHIVPRVLGYMGKPDSGRLARSELSAHYSWQYSASRERDPAYTGKAELPHYKSYLQGFKDKFLRLNKELGKKQFLTYYLIAAHPGCDAQDMEELKAFIRKELKTNVEQVQIFTPLPSTYSALMYYTEIDPFTKKPIFVEKDIRNKERQKSIIVRR